MASDSPAKRQVNAFVIVNPTGRDGAVRRKWPKIKQRLLDAHVNIVTERMTEHAGHAGEIAYELGMDLPDTINCIISIGGDGTFHEIASGIRGSKAAHSITLCIIPLGSGNDYSRGHAIPHDDIDVSIDIICNGVDRRVSAIRVEGRAAPPPRPELAPFTITPWDGAPSLSDPKENIVRWAFQECDIGLTSTISRYKAEGYGSFIHGSLKYTYLGIRGIVFSRRSQIWFKVDDEEPQVQTLPGFLYIFYYYYYYLF